MGVALLHVERARADLGPWSRAHDWLACATGAGIAAGQGSHLFYGAPALAHVMRIGSLESPRYAGRTRRRRFRGQACATIRLPGQTAPSRSGHYWIDLSRGWLMHGDRQQALACLNSARRVAPQLTRYHPQVRQTVQALAAQETRATNSLHGFAAWCGLTT